MKYINIAYQQSIVKNVNKDAKEGNVMHGLNFLHGQEEFNKILNHNAPTLTEIEKQHNIEFPISLTTLHSLPPEVQSRLITPTYGLSTETIEYRYFDYKVAIELKLKFFIPIRIDSGRVDELDINKLSLPVELLQYINSGKAVIILYQNTEGHFHKDTQIDWFNSFASRFGLDETKFIVESANFKWRKLVSAYRLLSDKYFSPKPVLFTPKLNSNFFERLWFSKKSIHTIVNKSYHYQKFNNFLFNRMNKVHNKKILCLQRRQSDIRCVVFHKLHTDPKLSNCSLYSLLNPYRNSLEAMMLQIKRLRLDNSAEISEWFKHNFDAENGHSLDQKDHFINWAVDLNPDLYNNTFINLTIETHQYPSSELFFSEKTLKPIYAAQPFILFGNPESLKYLKKLGYKTFSDFWDESYDENVPIQERLKRLFNLLDYIAEKPMKELNEMLEDLQPILEHNFNVLMDTSNVLKKNIELSKWCMSNNKTRQKTNLI